MTLPSKKIVPVIALAVVLVGIVAVTIFYNPSAPANSHSASGASLTVVSAANQSGLAQNIYQKIETELTTLATSSLANANGQTASSSLSSSAAGLSGAGGAGNSAAPQASTTATAVLSQEFLTEYLSMKQSGQQITPDTENSMISDLVATGGIDDYIPQARIYTQNDIHVENDNSSAAFHAYGNALGTILAKNAVPQGLNELNILQTAVTSNNPQDLANLAIIVKSYSGIATGIAATPVPSDAIAIHLALLNDFSQALNSVQGMQKLFTDPVVAVTAVENYQDIAADTYNDLSALTPLFQKDTTAFAPGEAGAVFIIQGSH